VDHHSGNERGSMKRVIKCPEDQGRHNQEKEVSSTITRIEREKSRRRQSEWETNYCQKKGKTKKKGDRKPIRRQNFKGRGEG